MMKTTKYFFVLSVIATILTGCESKTKSMIRGSIKGINERCPIVVNDYCSISSAELSNDTVVYKMLVTEEDMSMELLKKHPEERRKYMLTYLTGQSISQQHDFRMMVDENLWLKIMYIGHKSKETVTLLFSPDEMKKSLENPMSKTDVAELMLKMEEEQYNSSLPMEMEKGISWTKAERKDKSFIYTFLVDERYFDVDLIKANEKNVKDGMVPSISADKGHLKALVTTNRELHYKYVGNKSGRSVILTFSVDELESLL